MDCNLQAVVKEIELQNDFISGPTSKNVFKRQFHKIGPLQDVSHLRFMDPDMITPDNMVLKENHVD